MYVVGAKNVLTNAGFGLFVFICQLKKQELFAECWELLFCFSLAKGPGAF